MAGLLQAAGPLGERYRLDTDNAGALDTIVIDSSALPSGPVAPFRARYFVDPAFTGVQTGSSANPFTTIAAAFAFASALGISAGIVYVVNGPIVENVVMPTSGQWELAAPNYTSFAQPTVLTGTVTINVTASAFHVFTGLGITGAIAGNASASCRVMFRNCQTQGAVNLTSSGGASLRALFSSDGPGPTGVNGFSTGAVSIGGSIIASGWRFNQPLTLAAASEFNTCTVDLGFVLSGVAPVTLRLVDCTFGNGVSFTAAGAVLSVLMGPATVASLMQAGGVVAGPNVILQPLTSNQAGRFVTNNNVALGQFPLGQAYPGPCMVTCEATLTLLTAGTAGAAVLNAIYNDLLGVLQTKPVTPALNIASAAGTETQGTLTFSQGVQGVPSGLTFSVTGIVTPGALSYSIGISFRVAR